MKCKCGVKAQCVDSRPAKDSTTRRRYTCPACNTKFSTIEEAADFLTGNPDWRKPVSRPVPLAAAPSVAVKPAALPAVTFSKPNKPLRFNARIGIETLLQEIKARADEAYSLDDIGGYDD